MLWESKLPAWQRDVELPLSQPFFDKVSPGNIILSRWMQSYHDGEAKWEHSTLVHAKITGHNHVKSLAGLSITNWLRPTDVNLLLPPLSGTVCDPGASPRISPNANILGFGGCLLHGPNATSFIHDNSVPFLNAWNCLFPMMKSCAATKILSPQDQIITPRVSR